MGLQSSPNSPCLFVGTLIPGEAPIYVGIYVDDIIYFSKSDLVERQFEQGLSTIGSVEFMGQVSLFLGIEFSWVHHENGGLSVHLTQQSFAESLIESLGFDCLSTSYYLTPYRSGYPVDSVVHESMSSSERDALRLAYQSIVGSLNWLAHTTCPDLSTIVSMLAQHQSNPSPGHMAAAHYATKYLAHTKTLGISFSSEKRELLQSFLHFPVNSSSILSMSDADWGPQDARQTKTKPEFHSFRIPLYVCFLY